MRRLATLFGLGLVLLVGGCGAVEEEDVGTAAAATKICPAGTVLEGVDVSHWNGTITWSDVKASNKAFAIAKVTEGTGSHDSEFVNNWPGMKQAGLVRGGYHFFRANADAIAQADWFLSKLGPLEPGDLPPVLDLETTDGQSSATITAKAIAWLDHVAAATNTKPILYTGPAFVTALGNPAGLQDHAQLWAANWGVTCPDVPAPFSGFVFWQYADKGTVSGIGGATDLDRFNGSMADLMAVTVQASSSSSSTSSSSSSTSSSSTSSSSTSSSSTSSSGSTASGEGGGAGGNATTGSTGDGGAGGEGAGGASSTSQPAAKGGCGCGVAADSTTAPAGLLGALAWLAARRRRR